MLEIILSVVVFIALAYLSLAIVGLLWPHASVGGFVALTLIVTVVLFRNLNIL